MKFKVGDVVRVIKESQYYCNMRVGDVGTVVCVDIPSGDGQPVKVDAGYSVNHWIEEDALELVKPAAEKSPKYQIVYKLVDRYEDGLGSWAKRDGCHHLDYSMLSKTKGIDEEHPIFAFDSVQSIVAFLETGMRKLSDYVVLKCLAKVGGDNPPDNNRLVPDGTVFCHWVIPLEEVEE